MISIADVEIVKKMLANHPMEPREKRAADNLLAACGLALDARQPVDATEPSTNRVPPALARFDAMSGVQKVRDMERIFGYCRESFLDRLSLLELLQVRRMWLASGWDFLPDQWTERQLTEALAGRVPTWDENEEPTY